MRPGSYTYLTANDWSERVQALDRLAAECALCPRSCGADRSAGTRGFCGAPGEIVISSIFPHHGEEPPISGTGGSGTVFFTHCTLKCVFCQNYQISHQGEGRVFDEAELAQRMLGLQAHGCHNINLVTATHFLPGVVRALRRAATGGLTLPVVYNSGGYERAETIDLLRDIVDIWLPDMKYGADAPALRYSKAPDYVQVNRDAVRRMFRQVGPLRCDDQGIAERGVCIRHLVLPDGQSASGEVLAFLRSSFDPEDVCISLMAQYRPMYGAVRYPELAERVSAAEYEAIRDAFIAAGFTGFYQDHAAMDGTFCIDFTRRKSEPLTGR